MYEDLLIPPTPPRGSCSACEVVLSARDAFAALVSNDVTGVKIAKHCGRKGLLVTHPRLTGWAKGKVSHIVHTFVPYAFATWGRWISVPGLWFGWLFEAFEIGNCTAGGLCWIDSQYKLPKLAPATKPTTGDSDKYAIVDVGLGCASSAEWASTRAVNLMSPLVSFALKFTTPCGLACPSVS